ncbi:MAG: uroporphyrinogen-III synthase [Limisphaerales bacterium]|jgi:uroporphyrinogen-III synthase
MKSFWITRSQPGADELARAVEGVSVNLEVTPLLRIVPSDGWRGIAPPLPDLVIVTSRHAIKSYQQSELFEHSQGVPHIAIGQATQKGLEGAVNDLSCPQVKSSEGVLAMPVLVDLTADAVVWLIGGEGGREVLQGSLAKRGVQPVKLDFYRRQLLSVGELSKTVERIPELVEVSSKTSLGVLSEFCAKQSTAKTSTCPQLVVASERLAELASEQGFVQIEIADSAEVEAMARAVKRILGEGRE